MKIFITVIGLGLLCVGSSFAADSVAAIAPTSRIELFNGRDFTSFGIGGGRRLSSGSFHNRLGDLLPDEQWHGTADGGH